MDIPVRPCLISREARHFKNAGLLFALRQRVFAIPNARKTMICEDKHVTYNATSAITLTITPFSRNSCKVQQMMSLKLRNTFVVSVIVLHVVSSRGDDFMASVDKASAALEPEQEVAGKMLLSGDLEGSNKHLLDAFPESTRTSAQAFVLGNVLFQAAPETSYKLHQKVAKDLPDESYAQLEWALQQHRAKEYAGAAEAYAIVVKAMPHRAVFHGMQAECLIQTGKIAEAVDAWKRSEEAKSGTLIDFESMVCEINGGFTPIRDRCLLREKVQSGDADAAEELVLHDASFSTDWWNSRVNVQFLREDIQRN